MQRLFRSLIAVAALVLITGVALPAEDGLPAARKIIDDYIEAIGGEKAIKKMHSAEATGTFAIPAAGLSGSITIYSQAPDKSLVDIEVTGMGNIREGFDGNVAWGVDPMQGPMVKDGKAAEQAKFRSDAYASLHTDDRYKSMETVAQVEFEGQTCYKVRLLTTGDDEVIEYFDVETKLQVGSEMSAETPMGPIALTVLLADYKPYGGVHIPTKITQKMAGMEQVISVADAKLNGVDPSVFELPAEIKALVDAEPATDEQTDEKAAEKPSE